MKIFETINYREAIRYQVEVQRSLGEKLTYSDLAASARIQKSYLSKVLAGGAELNADQLYLIAEVLGWEDEKRDYVLLLLDWEKASLKQRKSELLNKIETIQKRHRLSEVRLKTVTVTEQSGLAHQYYLDPLIQVIHMALCVPQYARSPLKLSQFLHIPESKIVSTIQFLIKENLVKKKANSYEVLQKGMHLPKKSPVYPAWMKLLSQVSKEKISRSSEQDPYSFQVVFTTNPKIKNSIHSLFLDFLEQVEEKAKKSKPEEVYQMSFDLFSWTQN